MPDRFQYNRLSKDDAALLLVDHQCGLISLVQDFSPGEFKNFIGPQMRLTPVQVAHEHKIPNLLRFYMGRNTPERRQFIMEHLRIEAED